AVVCPWDGGAALAGADLTKAGVARASVGGRTSSHANDAERTRADPGNVDGPAERIGGPVGRQWEVGEGGSLLRRGDRRVATDVLTGDQVDDAAGDGDGVVAEALVEPAQQGQVDGRLHTVGPGGGQQLREQLPLQLVHAV